MLCNTATHNLEARLQGDPHSWGSEDRWLAVLSSLTPSTQWLRMGIRRKREICAMWWALVSSQLGHHIRPVLLVAGIEEEPSDETSLFDPNSRPVR